jgi:DNA-binding IscR family transcriptional regulator
MNSCCRIKSCPTRDVWVNLSNVIKKSLQAVSLKDIITQYKIKSPELNIDYSI